MRLPWIELMSTKKPSLGRHTRTRSACRHMKCVGIETDFIAWRSPASIAEEYALSDRSSIQARPCPRAIRQAAAQRPSGAGADHRARR